MSSARSEPHADPIRRRLTAVAILLAVAACGSVPAPSGTTPDQATPTAKPSWTLRPIPTWSPSPARVTFRFDVVNRSSTWVVVSVASDTAAWMPGFEAGERGSILILVRDPLNGIGIELLGPPSCGVLATVSYPTPDPFTLYIDGGEGSAYIMTTEPGVAGEPIPLPVNARECPGG